MKKVVSFCVMITFLISLCTPFVGAAGGLSRSEAIDILKKGFARCNMMAYGFDSYDLLTEEEQREILLYEYMHLDYGYGKEETEGKVFETDTSLSGEKYPRIFEYYYAYAGKYGEDSTTPPEYLTMDIMDSYILEYFTPEMKSKLYFAEENVFDEETNERIGYVMVDRFRTDPETGYLLGLDATMEYFNVPWHITWNDDTVKHISFTSSASKAELKVLAYQSYIMFGAAPMIETVEFQKTKSGWKISGGSLFGVCFLDGMPSYDQGWSEFDLLAINAYAEASILHQNYSEIYLYPNETSSGKKYYVKSDMYEMFSEGAYGRPGNITYMHSTKGEEYASPELYYRSDVGGWYTVEMHKRVEEYKEHLSSVMLPALYEPWLCADNGVEYFRNEYITASGILVSKRFFDYVYSTPSTYSFEECNGVRMLSSKKAEIYVILSQRDKNTNEDIYYLTSFEAVKTADGWRASGGEMFDVIRGEAVPKIYVPVETGDDSEGRIIFLAILATLSLAAACRGVKRRR